MDSDYCISKPLKLKTKSVRKTLIKINSKKCKIKKKKKKVKRAFVIESDEDTKSKIDRKYFCCICDFVSTKQAELREHGKNIHGSDKVFKCKICEYAGNW